LRALGIVFGGPPGGITGLEDRARAVAACWQAGVTLDLALGACTRTATQAMHAAWPADGDGDVVLLEPPARDPRPWWRRRGGPRDGPRQPGAVPAILGPFDPTVPRHQVAKALRGRRYDAVWCADPVAMAYYGKVRRDLPVVLDVPAPQDPTDRAALVDDPGEWHRFEQHIAASAHLVTVPTAGAREVLGVPGAMVLDPASPRDREAFLKAVAEVCRWSDDFHGMRG